MNRHGSPAGQRSLVESLESRLFLSVSPLVEPMAVVESAEALRAAPAPAATTYNLVDLLGYNRRGAAWTYDTTYQVGGSVGPESGSTSARVQVDDRIRRIAGRRSHIVRFSAGDNTVATAWSRDRRGINLTGLALIGDFGRVDLQLFGTRVAPLSLGIGQTHSDRGTFSGRFNASDGDRRVSGTITGRSRATTELTGMESVTVPAGTFDAVRGVYSVDLEGTLRARYRGRTFRVPFTATVQETFWAAPGTGVVQSATSLRASADIPFIGDENITADATSVLTARA